MCRSTEIEEGVVYMDWIQMQVPMVIQILDAVTGSSLEQSGSRPELRSTEGKQPIYKGDGYYLFFQPPKPEAGFMLQAYGYQTLWGRWSDLVFQEGMGKIYMQPDLRYPLSTELYGLQGRAEPGTTLLLVCGESDERCRLVKDYEAGARELTVSPGRKTLGGEYRIREQEQAEFLKITEIMDAETGQYRLAVSLSHSYRQGRAVLVPVKRIPVDASGEFVWYLRRKKGNRAVLPCELWKPDGRNWQELELRAGTRVSIGRIE